jgi:uncharacterized protein YjdB/predicted phosphodiesterase
MNNSNKNRELGQAKKLRKNTYALYFLPIVALFTLTSLLVACGEKDENEEEEEPTVVAVTGITVTPDAVSLLPGQTKEIIAKVNPSGVSQDVIWTSSDPAVATVENGIITAIKAGIEKEGIATIAVTSVADETKSATIAVTVEIPIKAVVITPQKKTIVIHQTQQIINRIDPYYAKQGVTFTTDNPAVVTVNDEGLATAVGVGTANIAVTSVVDTTKISVCELTVVSPVEVTVAPTGLFLNVGEEHTINATVTGDNNKQVTWTSTNPAVATVSNGIIKGVGAGTAHIRAASVADPATKAVVSVFVSATSPNALPRFVVMSDTHFGKSGTDPVTVVSASIKNLLGHGPQSDAIFIVGDMTDHGFPNEYAEMFTVVNNKSVVPANVAIYYSMGNHDYFAEANYFSELASEGDPYPLHQDIWMKGYHFIMISLQGSNTDGYTKVAYDFLLERLTAARAESPGKPIFVFMHSPSKGTVFGSENVDGSSELTPVLVQFPEAIAFSGHSHATLENNKSIYQDKFTAINEGCNTSGRGEGVITEVQSNGNVAVYRWNSLTNISFQPDWLIEAPHDGTRFKYK